MEERSDNLGPPAPTPRRAYWPVALLLGGLVLAILGAAFVLDQRFRSSFGIEPVAVITVPTQMAAAAPTVASVPTVGPQPTALPTRAATPTAVATTAPTTVPTSAPATSPVVPAAVASPAPKSAADLLSPLQKEIIDAYLRYWDARIRAYYDADPAPLAEAMAGDELAREQQQVIALRSQGRAVRIDVEHDFRVVSATADEAVVYDEYVNRSRVIDGATKQQLSAGQTQEVEKITYQFRKVNGGWKVVDGTQNG